MTKIFKKLLLSAGLAALSIGTHAQNGLNAIVVEKYYIANATDSIYSDAALPVGSVTYRIYADMLSGYKFQAAYGNGAHLLKVTTSTKFFNASAGATTPDGITKTNEANNTTMLDSWVSAGAACKVNYGLLKTDDNGVLTVVNNTPAAPGNKILQGTNLQAGIPVKTQDGFLSGFPSASNNATSVVGTLDLSAIDATSLMGDSIGTNNGAWSALAGNQGPLYPASNRVIIGQFTTNGIFHFELNIQIGDSIGGTQKFVTSSPASGEITIASLVQTFTPDVPPTCSITAPANHSTFITGNPVNITAVASDAADGGTVDSVQFFVDGVYIGSDATSPYNATWTSTVGTHYLTAVATAHDLGQTTSANDTIVVAPAHLPYGIITTSGLCYNQTFCVPIAAQDPIANIIGYDMVLNYDKTKVTPTGNFTISNDLVQSSYVAPPAFTNNATTGTLTISLYFNASAPAGTNFHGIGNLMCVEFAKTGGFGSADSAAFSASSFQESYFSGVAQKGVDPGKFKTFRDSTFTSSLSFWTDNSPIKYDSLNPASYLITNIYGNNTGCGSKSATAVQPDLSGNFVYSLTHGVDVDIEKDILGTTDVQPVINGFDAYLTRKVLLNDLSFIPNIYQAIAMDVNEDGVISAGDLSQINQRTVLLIPEFKQAWNYTSSGTKIPGTGNSKDWLFLDVTRVSTNPAYGVSSTFPSDDGIGFSKSRVPVVPFCLPVPIAASGCKLTAAESYKGVLIGDVNGNYSTAIPNNQFRQDGSSKIVVDLSNSVSKDGYAEVPVSVFSANNVNALDLSMQLNDGNLAYNSVVNHANYLEALSNFNADDKTFRFTSSSMQNYELGKSLLSVRFAVNNGKVSESDLNGLQGYLNGERVAVEIKTGNSSSANVDLYPNPANGFLNIQVSEDATAQLMSVDGKSVIIQTNISANHKQVINTQSVAAGVYMMKIYNDNFVTVKKVVISK